MGYRHSQQRLTRGIVLPRVFVAGGDWSALAREQSFLLR